MLPEKLLLVFLFFIFYCEISSCWIWTCDTSSGQCGRLIKSNSTDTHPTLELCRLTCGDEGIVWPKPKYSSFFDKALVNVDIESVSFKFETTDNKVKEFLTTVSEYFKEVSKSKSNTGNKGNAINCSKQVYKIVIYFEVEKINTDLSWETDEQYNITINTNDRKRQMKVVIHGKTVFGVRHGVETLLQLINTANGISGSICYVTIKKANIFDEPAYKHRGLLIDTARNFLSIDLIKENIVAMGMSKMNVLHWHISDSASFPFVSKRVPNLTRYGAYSDKEIYTPDDVRGLIKFAENHGVRIIPEIDSPGHAGSGWQWGVGGGYGNMVTCYEWQPYTKYCVQPPCGQMNPVNQKIYNVLGLLYADILDLWPNLEAFHMGGDEVSIDCWNSTRDIIKYLGPNHRTETDFLNLWGMFYTKAVQAFDSHATRKNTPIILWTSKLTDAKYVEKYLSPSRYIIQSWEPFNSTLPDELLKLGYKLIFSTKYSWYLDHGFRNYAKFHDWRKVYDNKISTHKNVLGGEVCSWGEVVDDSEAEPRVWPRAAAAAERLWSNPKSDVTSYTVEARFFLHRERLVSRGVRAAAVTQQYCVQQEGKCNI